MLSMLFTLTQHFNRFILQSSSGVWNKEVTFFFLFYFFKIHGQFFNSSFHRCMHDKADSWSKDRWLLIEITLTCWDGVMFWNGIIDGKMAQCQIQNSSDIQWFFLRHIWSYISKSPIQKEDFYAWQCSITFGEQKTKEC